MNPSNKRMNTVNDPQSSKRMKKECTYGEKCYRLNPAHFREFSHPHLEEILDNYNGNGDYDIPEKLVLQKSMIVDQLNIIIEKNLYVAKQNNGNSTVSEQSSSTKKEESNSQIKNDTQNEQQIKNDNQNKEKIKNECKLNEPQISKEVVKKPNTDYKRDKSPIQENKVRDSDYRPIIPPTRKYQDYFKVIPPKGKMAAKHEASAPYHIFYTTITDAKETHSQPYSITFQEILDSSLGELKCSLQINFMVDPSWLLAQYYFAGYSAKKLTILYGDDSPDMKTLSQKKPHVETHLVTMATPFAKHHTKMMVLCYEDGSTRVVVSTANLYIDDWENRTQGLWFSPRCPQLPPEAMPHDGESPTMFKRSLIRYLGHYHLPQLTYYMDRIKRCDFSHINVFLVASAPGSHFDTDWALTRVGSLLRQHCCVQRAENKDWPLIAQASSLGSYGKEPKLWLTGDFLHHFTKIKDQAQTLSTPPQLKLIYPSLVSLIDLLSALSQMSETRLCRC
ncbi:probable tyrosyl-DNA phosphodiesterase isoform X2 [Colias croceus]|uniref:probable tyrosyl-DNA phosphodiesterase isoform X2 n=1 Tax=Colias crocea TaxID=72248 RepID=UPI001E27AF48|nr:probable tyrosyl-DNA phosphodiesterase isoform X2 [Colias croceus]